MSEVNIKTCLREWRRKYGEERVAKTHGQTYWRIPIQNRRHLIKIFLRWMRALGLEQERFTKSSFQDELISICFGNAPAFDEKRRKNGHEALKEELEDILATEHIFSGKRRRRNKNAPTNSLSAAPMKPQDLIDYINKANTTEEVKVMGRDVDKNLYKHVSNFEPELDEDFAALIGVTKDE